MAADHNDTFFQSYRSLLATLWSCVVLLTMVSFSVAGFFTFKSNPYAETDDYYNNYNDEPQEENRNDPEVVVTSRAIIFCSLWTAVLAFLVAIYGTVILGIQTPTLYYTCCSPHVHKTTGLSLGSLIGALLMFANLTLVCAVMFGEFNVRLYVFVERMYSFFVADFLISLNDTLRRFETFAKEADAAGKKTMPKTMIPLPRANHPWPLAFSVSF